MIQSFNGSFTGWSRPLKCMSGLPKGIKKKRQEINITHI
jgi:hypothetical protein